MSGICGYLTCAPEKIPDAGIITAMCNAQSHRGVGGGCGVYRGDGIGLGVVGDDQVFSDSAGRYHLVFDGAVYNQRELRDDLLGAGAELRTASDAELVLYGLILRGLDFLRRINGMFALALWDKEERSLTLARDRFGIKPLYWAHTRDGEFIFASEAAAVAAALPDRPNIDPSALGLYLAHAYIPGERAIFSDAKRLLPGQYLRVTQGSEPRPGVWWNLRDEWDLSVERGKAAGKNWLGEFAAILEDAVRIRLGGDTPPGAFLSGGIDSATITAVMKRQGALTKTYTMAFREASFNEAEQARETAAALGTEHLEEPADIASADRLLSIAARLDEPFADTSIIPTDALCQWARRHVSAAMAGDGADELLAGYITHQADTLYQYARQIPGFVFRPLRALINALPDSDGKVNAVFKLKQFAAAWPHDLVDAHASWRLMFDSENLGHLFTRECVNPFTPFRAAWDESEGLSALDRMLFVDYKTWFAHSIVVKADRAGAGHGLDLRSPFLDHRLFDLCAGMPAQYKRCFRKGKIILRQAAAALLPPFVLARPKTGFNAPVSTWLRGQWREVAEDAFSPASLVSSGLEPGMLVRMWQNHAAHKHNCGFQLFTVLMYILWHRKHILGSPATC